MLHYTGSGEQGQRRAEDEEDSAQHTQQKVCRGDIVFTIEPLSTKNLSKMCYSNPKTFLSNYQTAYGLYSPILDFVYHILKSVNT